MADKQKELKENKKHEKFSFWDKRKLKRKPEKSYCITMLFSNGTSRSYVLTTNKETFKYKKRVYYLKYDEAWFDLTHNQYRLFFFDDVSVPINRSITKKGDEAYFSVTPENLKPLLDMEYVKVLAQSHEISKFLKFGLIVGFMNLLISAVILYLIYKPKV